MQKQKYQIKPIKKQAGFTLIELLIVVSIIGLLASIILVSVSSARVKGRDAKRKGELHQLITGLAFYYDKHGAYPATSYAGACGTAINGSDLVSTGLIADNIMSTLPKAPASSVNCGDTYYSGTWNNAQNIAVLTALETVDQNCVSWPGPNGWITTGSYCNGLYILVQ